jgi:hypothetical protein
MSAALDLDMLEAAAREMTFNTIRAAVKAKTFFDVSLLNPLDQIFDAEAETVARKTREFKVLRNLHCQDFAAMPEEVRDAIPALIEIVVEAARANFEERKVQSFAPGEPLTSRYVVTK